MVSSGTCTVPTKNEPILTTTTLRQCKNQCMAFASGQEAISRVLTNISTTGAADGVKCL